MKIASFFENNKGKFDLANPAENHLERFEQRLKKQRSKKNHQRVFLGIVATIVVLIGLTFSQKYFDKTRQEIPVELAESQQYFSTIINNQLKDLKKKSTPKTQELIKDSILELNDLKNDYNTLMQELKTSKNQQYIISMMIQNFQQRIALLEAVSKQLENLNNSNYEII